MLFHRGKRTPRAKDFATVEGWYTSASVNDDGLIQLTMRLPDETNVRVRLTQDDAAKLVEQLGMRLQFLRSLEAKVGDV